MIRAVILILAILFYSLAAFTQELAGEFKDWAVFTSKEQGRKVCYITSSPTKKSGKYKTRGDVYIIITSRGENNAPEVSVDNGYAFKSNSEAELTVNGKKTFKLFTSAQTPQMAWGKDADADRAIIAALKNGSKVTVKGSSARNNDTVDTYSLRGFSAAYNKMNSSCK